MSQYKWNMENPSEMSEMFYSAQAHSEGKKIIQRTIPKEILLLQQGYHVRPSNYGFRNKRVSTTGGKKTIQVQDEIEGPIAKEMFTLRAKGHLKDSEITDRINLM
jgi:hypothetical protein